MTVRTAPALLALLWPALCLASKAQEKPPLHPMVSQKATTRITWYGHAAFRIDTPKGAVVLIDPWLQNPANKGGAEQLEKLEKADLILVTHGHGDHVGDAVAIAKKTSAQLVATADLGKALVAAGVPAAQFPGSNTGNFGGEIELLGGEVKVAFIPAVHSSTVTVAEGDVRFGGSPGGFLVTVANGPAVYHTGDTDLFGDMALIKRFHHVDVMLSCIGDRYTMGPERAAQAVLAVEPTWVTPMHFGTFPALSGSAEAFEAALKASGSKARLKVMQVGETWAL